MKSCFMASVHTIMILTGPRSTHCSPHVYSAHLECFVAHSDKRCPVSKSFFTHSLKYYSLSSSTTWPTLSALARPTISRSLKPNSCSDISHCRTISSIIWSCIVTTFSCTWVAVHPNIPCPKKREGKNCFQEWMWNPFLLFVEHHLPLCITCTRVCASLGHSTKLESLGNSL